MQRAESGRGELVELLADLGERVASSKLACRLSELWERLTAWERFIGGAAEGDQLLGVEEAARRLGVSTDWLYRNAAKLPFAVRLGPRQLRFSSRGIERYIHQRQARG